LALGAVLGGAVGELAGEAGPAEGALALDELAGLARRGAGLRAERDLLDDPFGVVRVVVEPLGELLADEALDGALHLGVAELGLGLALELRLGDLHAQDGGEALAE